MRPLFTLLRQLGCSLLRNFCRWSSIWWLTSCFLRWTVFTPRALTMTLTHNTMLETLTIGFLTGRLFAGAAFSVLLSRSTLLQLVCEGLWVPLQYFVLCLLYHFAVLLCIAAAWTCALGTAELAPCKTLTIHLQALGFWTVASARRALSFVLWHQGVRAFTKCERALFLTLLTQRGQQLLCLLNCLLIICSTFFSCCLDNVIVNWLDIRFELGRLLMIWRFLKIQDTVWLSGLKSFELLLQEWSLTLSVYGWDNVHFTDFGCQLQVLDLRCVIISPQHILFLGLGRCSCLTNTNCLAIRLSCEELLLVFFGYWHLWIQWSQTCTDLSCEDKSLGKCRI